MLSRTFTRREQWIMVGLSAAIVAGAAVIVWQRQAPGSTGPEPVPSYLEITPAVVVAPPEPDTPSSEAVTEDPPLASKVTVAVRGAVRYPGMYELLEGHRVDDLLERAGGMTERADGRDINIAAPLLDGSTLTVPAFPDPETGMYGETDYPAHAALNPSQYTVSGWQPHVATSVGGRSASGGGEGSALLDLNRATQAELETLPGIGPVTAASIITYREQSPFRAVDELQQVTGIGPKRLETIRDMVTVSGR
mgnify:CR=1 FL=1